MNIFYQNLFSQHDPKTALKIGEKTNTIFLPYIDYIRAAIKSAEQRMPSAEYRLATKTEDTKLREQTPTALKRSGTWILLINEEDAQEATLDAFISDEARITLDPNHKEKSQQIKVLASCSTPYAILVDKALFNDKENQQERAKLWLQPNTYALTRQRNALNELTQNPTQHTKPLLGLNIEPPKMTQVALIRQRHPYDYEKNQHWAKLQHWDALIADEDNEELFTSFVEAGYEHTAPNTPYAFWDPLGQDPVHIIDTCHIHKLIRLKFPAKSSRIWLHLNQKEIHTESHIDYAKTTTWQLLSDTSRDGTMEQQRFVQNALNSPDFTILNGPPGSGKTTAICELIVQQIIAGKRVLLSASTHIAIDNVLERLIEWQSKQQEQLVLPIRIGDAKRISNHISAQYTLENLRTKYHEDLLNFLKNPQSGSAIGITSREMLASAIESKETQTLDNLLLESANLICGTTIGLLQHPEIKAKNKQRHSGFRHFDMLILDEASKTTFPEFLVPAILAKRWVIVGDIRQLSPYVDETDVSDSINLRINNQKLKPEQKKAIAYEIAWRLIRKNELRQANAIETQDIDTQIRKLTAEAGIAPSTLEQLSVAALTSVLETITKPHRNGCNFITEDDKFRKLTSLSYQHRMHPDISKFPRDNFYRHGSQLKDASEMAEKRRWSYNRYASRATWINIAPNSSTNNGKNENEANVILRELKHFMKWAEANPKPDNTPWEISILTFYRQQENLLKNELKTALNEPTESHTFSDQCTEKSRWKIKLCTVDRFQGHEADIVLLSFVNANGRVGFLNSPNRLNVALTRSRYQLVLIGHRSGFAMNSCKSELLQKLATSNAYGHEEAWN